MARGNARLCGNAFIAVGFLILSLDSAQAQMNMPGMRFHSLQGGGRHSVWVDENYRVTFRFESGHAYEVDYEDYH